MPVVSDFTALLGTNWNQIQSGAQQQGTPVLLTFSFPTAPPPSYTTHLGAPAAATFRSFNATEQAAARDALNAWASVSGITFVEVSGDLGDLRFSWINFAALANPEAVQFSGLGNFPYPAFFQSNGTIFPASEEYGLLRGSNYDVGGDTFYDSGDQISPLQLYSLLRHEIGHALGMKHPFETTPTNDRTLVASLDNKDFTTMSYTRTSQFRDLGQLDIEAAQYFYGGPQADGAQFAAWSFNATTQTITIQGRNTGELIRGTGTHDIVYGNAGDDIIYTSSGNDTIIGGAGRDSVSGGTGRDTYVFEFGRAQGTFQRSVAADGFELIFVTSSDGQERFVDVERFQFTDAIVAVDIDGNAGDAYRIYQAAFDRTPDRSGLSYWVDQMDDGMPLSQVALNFILSPEFTTTYGNINAMTNAQFVNVVYENVLHRAPDSGGFSYWMNDLTNGYPRHYMLAAFSQSAENQANVAAAIQNGILLDLGAFV